MDIATRTFEADSVHLKQRTFEAESASMYVHLKPIHTNQPQCTGSIKRLISIGKGGDLGGNLGGDWAHYRKGGDLGGDLAGDLGVNWAHYRKGGDLGVDFRIREVAHYRIL